MDRDEFRALLRELRERSSELEDVELKSAHAGTPADIWKTICAFSNRRGGGTIVFGVSEHFDVVGVGDVDKLQRDLTEAATQLEPPVRLSFSTVTERGKTVLIAEVPEVDPQFRPCYRPASGLYHGAYVRVGDSERAMTEYEVYLALSSRTQPQEDLRKVEGASLADLDENRLNAFLTDITYKRPQLAAFADDRAGLLTALNIVARDDPEVPTLAGLLIFGRYPQSFFPNLVITVSAYAGDQPDPEARLEADTLCEGPLLDMLEEAYRVAGRFIRKRTIVSGLVHERVPEYPLEAIREALVNAVAHRDYSRYALSTQVQVRFFPDRVEIQNPGGLYGVVPVDLLGQLGIQSTRNAALARLLQDLGPMENRGTGLAAMAAAMRRAHLPPPQFTDGTTYFRVTLRNESLLDEASLTWLNRFAPYNLSERQRLALVYAKRFHRITAAEYRLLLPVDSRQATRELKGLVQAGLLEQRGATRGTIYVLSGPARDDAPRVPAGERPAKSSPRTPPLRSSAARVLAAMEPGLPARTSELAAKTGLSRLTVIKALKELINRGLVEPTSDKLTDPNRRYVRLR